MKDGLTSILRATALAVAVDLAEVERTPVHLAAAVLLVVSVGWQRLRESPIFWALIALVAWGSAARGPLFVANHHYLVAGVSTGVALALTSRAGFGAHWERQARLFLIAVLGFSVVHKLLSPRFLDGSYLGFMIARGGFLEPFLVHVDAAAALLGRNSTRVDRFFDSPPATEAFVQLEVFPHLHLLAVVSAGVIIAVELLLVLALLSRPGAALTQASLLGFLAAVIALRQESVFAAQLWALTVALPGGRRRWLLAAGVPILALAVWRVGAKLAAADL